MLGENDLLKGYKRLLDTDRHLLIRYDIPVRFVVSSVDVLHSFALPSMGIKVDAVTGRLNFITMFVDKEGILTGHVLSCVVRVIMVCL